MNQRTDIVPYNREQHPIVDPLALNRLLVRRTIIVQQSEAL